MADADQDALASRVEIALGEPIRHFALVRGGGNNRIYRAELSSGPVAVKAYHAVADGSHLHRLERETKGLRRLRASGLRQVPDVRCISTEHAFAAYDWIEGVKLPVPVPDSERKAAIGAVIGFLDSLHQLRFVPNGERWLAQEACLSTRELLRQIDLRVERLNAIDEPTLRDFIMRSLAPVHGRARQRAVDIQAATTLPWDRDLPDAAQDFSPSDFGYHNALLHAQTGLHFVDFEYAGWDDAVKLTSDFLWHPAMELSPEERSAFLKAALARYRDVPDFAARLAAQHPLYGLRWSLILLNEFLPDRWQKRLFAAGGRLSQSDWEAAKMRQLDRAGAYLRAASRMVDTPARLDAGRIDPESWMAAWEGAPPNG